MKTYLECIPCFFIQVLRAAKATGLDEKKTEVLMKEIGKNLENFDLECSPPENAGFLYQRINEFTNMTDPYKVFKEESTKKCLEIYPAMKRKIEESDDRLLTAIRLAIAGNVIDFGALDDFDLETTIEKAMNKDFAVFDYERFKYLLDKTEEVLYIGDNAGESVFDSLLIEELGKPVKYVVREIPAINDVVYSDAVQAGIDRVAEIVSSGAQIPGTVTGKCSEKFRKIFYNSNFIISKGQGNYETLSEEKQLVFFLFLTKCSVVAEHLGVGKDDLILMESQSHRAKGKEHSA